MSWISASIQRSKEKFRARKSSDDFLTVKGLSREDKRYNSELMKKQKRQAKLDKMESEAKAFNQEANIIKKYEEAKTNRAEAKKIKYDRLLAPIKKVVSDAKRTRNKRGSRIVLGGIVSKSKNGSSKKVKGLLGEADSWEPKSLL